MADHGALQAGQCFQRGGVGSVAVLDFDLLLGLVEGPAGRGSSSQEAERPDEKP